MISPSEWILEWLAFVMCKYYNTLSTVPKWLLLILTGSFGTMFVNFFHSSTPASAQQQRVAQAAPTTSAAPPSQPAAPAATPSKTKSRQRKGKK